MRDKKNIRHLAIKFLKKYHPECLYAMISGSFVEEHFNETSDVDILLVSKLPDTVIVESYYYEGIEFQTIILPYNNILEIIEKEINNGEGTYLSILAKGEIILDNRRFLLKLKEYSTAKFKKGPTEAKPYEIMQLRARLTSKLLDLKGSSSYSDNFFILSDTIQKMLNLHSKHHRTWGNASKYASRSLEKFDPEFKNELVNSFTHFSKTKDTQPAINFLEKYLEHFGGQLNFFSTREVINEIRNDQLVIFFKSNSWNDLLSEIILPFHEYILSRIDSLEFIIYKSNIENEKEGGAYIIIKEDTKQLNEFIYPLTKSFFTNIFYGSKFKCQVAFPSSIDPLTLNFSSNIQHLVFPVLSGITAFFAKKYKITNYSNEQVVNDGIIITSLFKSLINYKTDGFVLFLNYVLDYYLPYSYNNEGELPFSFLPDKKQQILDEFEQKSKDYAEEIGSDEHLKKGEILEKYSAILEKLSEFNEKLILKYKTDEILISEFELSLLPIRVNKKTKYFWVIYRKLLSDILNSLFIGNRYKSYIIYLIIKHNDPKISA